MCATSKKAERGLLSSVLTNRCPRCRKGSLFVNPNPYRLKTTMRMPEHCPVCGQAYELETGFYFGTGYVSYGLSVMFTAAFFVLWYFTLGISIKDDSIFWWLGVNALLLIILQPLLQRLSRSIWIAFFVHYDPNWEKHVS
ncbi:MAG: DUF983 domain-containing protein [Bacteroidetes bacterium]|nr:DUF983 domain-containing protein [Bacteroidota bacterium]